MKQVEKAAPFTPHEGDTSRAADCPALTSGVAGDARFRDSPGGQPSFAAADSLPATRTPACPRGPWAPASDQRARRPKRRLPPAVGDAYGEIRN